MARISSGNNSCGVTSRRTKSGSQDGTLRYRAGTPRRRELSYFI
jgi:hypothetical protein